MQAHACGRLKKLPLACVSNQHSAGHCNRTILRVDSTRMRAGSTRMRVQNLNFNFIYYEILRSIHSKLGAHTCDMKITKMTKVVLISLYAPYAIPHAFYIKLKPHNKSLLSLCSTPCNCWYVINNFQVHQVLCSSLSPTYLCMCVVLSFFFHFVNFLCSYSCKNPSIY
jgi:hypothetical protein